MNKKFLLLFVLILGIGLFGARVQASGGYCARNGVVRTCTTLGSNPVSGQQTCEVDTWGECVPNCSINLSFSDLTPRIGSSYTATWSSSNVVSMNGYCSDNPDPIPLPSSLFNYTTTYTASINKTCYFTGENASGYSCRSNTVTQTVQPFCDASLKWDPSGSPTPLANGSSATETWSVTGNQSSISEDCNNATQNGSNTFNSLTSTKTCTVKGYDSNNTARCSASATVFVSPPLPSSNGGSITVNSIKQEDGTEAKNIQWQITSGGNNYLSGTGSGGKTDGVPNGTYTLGVVGGWLGRIVTSVSDHQTIYIAPPPPSGTTNPPPSHLECVSNACTPVSNTGTNTTNTSACSAEGNFCGTLSVYHLECVNYACKEVSGGGSNVGCSISAKAGDSCGGGGGAPGGGARNKDPNINLPFNGLYKIFSGFIKRAWAAIDQRTATFNITTRAAGQNITLAINTIQTTPSTPFTVNWAQNYTITGTTGLKEDAANNITLHKTITRDSNGDPQTWTVPDWRGTGTLTDVSGNFSIYTYFDCTSTDSGILSQSDYQDQSSVNYDPGDNGGGDTSNIIYTHKYCGGNVIIKSHDDTIAQNPVPINWTFAPPYKSTTGYIPSSGSGSDANFRTDRGLNTLNSAVPVTSGYTLKSINTQLQLKHRVAGDITLQPASPCAGFPCPQTLILPQSDSAYIGLLYDITWKKSTTNRTGSCTEDYPAIIVSSPDMATTWTLNGPAGSRIQTTSSTDVMYNSVSSGGGAALLPAGDYTLIPANIPGYTVSVSPLATQTLPYNNTSCTPSAYGTFTIHYTSTSVGGNLSCAPAQTSYEVGKTVTFTAYQGTGFSYSWSAPDDIVSSESSSLSSFSTSYSSVGTKTVTVSSGGNSATCPVNITEKYVPPKVSTLDLKINGVTDYKDTEPVTPTLSWQVQNVKNCKASGGSAGWPGDKESSQDWSQTLASLNANSYNYPLSYTLTCESAVGGPNLSQTVTATSLPKGSGNILNAGLTANPNSGYAPLQTTLTARADTKLTDVATYPLNYSFWWNCPRSSAILADIINACGDPHDSSIGAKFDGVNSLSKIVTATYGSAGNYYPKVIIEQSNLPSATDKKAVAVLTPPTPYSCTGLPPGATPCGTGTGLTQNRAYQHVDSCPSTAPADMCQYIGGTPPPPICTGVIPSGYSACDKTGTNLIQNKDYQYASICSVSQNNKCEYTSTIIGTPSCTFNPPVPSLIYRGQSSKLSWNCTDESVSCYIVGVTNSPGSYSGKATVWPVPPPPPASQKVTYTLSCAGGSYKATVDVSVIGLGETIPQ